MFIEGIEVIAHPNSALFKGEPVLELSKDIELSDEVRNDVDEYLLRMFGSKERMLVIGGKFYVSKQSYTKIKNKFINARNHVMDIYEIRDMLK